MPADLAQPPHQATVVPTCENRPPSCWRVKPGHSAARTRAGKSTPQDQRQSHILICISSKLRSRQGPIYERRHHLLVESSTSQTPETEKEAGPPLPAKNYGVTVNFAELLPVPPGVITEIFPVLAPVGTLAINCLSDFTMKVFCVTPPKVTLVVCVRLSPLIVTGVPTVPLGGVKPDTCGVTSNVCRLVNVPPGVVTPTNPVVAPSGTVAVR